MSRGFKITRQDGLTERDSNLAPWIQNFAGKNKNLTVVEQTRARDAQSLVSQINNIMGSKSRYATVSDAVNDMRERTGLDTYLNQLTANDKNNVKVADLKINDLNQDGTVDDFEVYMRETDFDPNNPYFDVGLQDGEEDLNNDLVGNILAAITVRNFKPDLTNYMNFGLGYVIGAKMSKNDGNVQLKKVYDEAKKHNKLAGDELKKKVNKTGSEAYPGEECEGGSCDAGQDNFDHYMSKLHVNEASTPFKIGFETGFFDLEHNQVGDILASLNATPNPPLEPGLENGILYGLGYCWGADISTEGGNKEIKRIFNYYHFKNKNKLAQLNVPTTNSNKIPESLAKYHDVADNIVNFIRNNIRNTNALGASVPAIQYDLLAIFGQRYGIETQDIMNEDVARFINNIIVSEMAMVGPEENNPNIGFGVGKNFGGDDMSDNNDAFKGLMPAK